MSLTVVQAFRFCQKCQTLFYEARMRRPERPRDCARRAARTKRWGTTFEIPVHATPSSNAQDRWRFCGTCWAMLYDGYPQKGACPGRSRGHTRETRFRHRFAVPHDIAGTATAQTQWRFCNKCYVMFYDGYQAKGRCTAGDGHSAQGYDFVLPHQRP